MSDSTRARPRRHAIIIGAGVAGLAAAQELLASPHNIQVTVLEARHRVGGRVLTTWLDTSQNNQDNVIHNHPSDPHLQPQPQMQPQRTPRQHSFAHLVNGFITPARIHPDNHSPLTAVDVGASIMHGCGDDSQLVFARAIHDKIRAPVVAGGGFYESTEHALWFDDRNAKRIPSETVVQVHNIFFMASRYMAAVSAVSDDGAADLQSVFESGLSYVCEHLGNRNLTHVERAIINKICARSVGYCSPMNVMDLMQASAGMDAASADIHIGVQHEEDDPPYPGELPSMSPGAIRQQAARLAKSVIHTQRAPKHMIANKRGGNGDRIVLDGYTPFLIDKLAQGVDIRFGQAVCGVTKVRKPTFETSPPQAGVASSGMWASNAVPGDPSMPMWHGDSDVHSRSIVVSTRRGDVYAGDFVIATLPLGVLREDHPESSVAFSPPLSFDKVEAIRGMGMGVHNKVILRFREKDVFWPSRVPQLNCVDPRFQFFNLHGYGKTGVILTHVFAQSGFAKGYDGLSDAGVVAEVLTVLGGMFCAWTGKDDEPSSDADSRVAARKAAARRRVSMLMGICENIQCGRSITRRTTHGVNDGRVQCNSCGLVMNWDEENEEVEKPSPSKSPGRSARLRDKAAKVKEEEDEGDKTNLDEIEQGPKQRNLTWSSLPAPEEYLVTRWHDDPYSLGSYSYMPCGSNWQMIEQIATPEPPNHPHPYLFFAGEHCSDLGWQCVHGAYETGIRAAQKLIACLESIDGAVSVKTDDIQAVDRDELGKVTAHAVQATPLPKNSPKRRKSRLPPTSSSHEFWSEERERALTRALIGYSDVYGNFNDVVDEISFALYNFKKEPTSLSTAEVAGLVHERIHERARDGDKDAKTFLNFHSPNALAAREGAFPKPFQEVAQRPRLVGLNGAILKERYAGEIVEALRNHAELVSKNKISYRETLRKIAVMLYRKDGGLMTKRCLPEYLRTQEFGSGPQKELFLEKYLPPQR